MLNSSLYLEDLQRINELSLPWEKLDHHNVLITGGTGLVGSCLTDALIYRNEYLKSKIGIWVLSRRRDSAVRTFGAYLDRPYFHPVFQDVADPVSLNENMDYIIHAAGKGDPVSFVRNPLGVMDANILGMHRLIEYAGKAGTDKIVYISSGEVYGRLPMGEEERITETMTGTLDQLNPRNCYGISKRAAETMCVGACRQLGLDISIARLCHTYGPTMTEGENRVIFQFLQNVLQNQDIVLKSAGTQKRSYLYAADAAAGILAVLLLGEREEAYNISNGSSVISIRELAEFLSGYSGRKVIREAQNEQEQKGNSGIMHAVLDDTKLKKLGAEMRYGIHDGLIRTLNILKEINPPEHGSGHSGY